MEFRPWEERRAIVSTNRGYPRSCKDPVNLLSLGCRREVRIKSPQDAHCALASDTDPIDAPVAVVRVVADAKPEGLAKPRH